MTLRDKVIGVMVFGAVGFGLGVMIMLAIAGTPA